MIRLFFFLVVIIFIMTSTTAFDETRQEPVRKAPAVPRPAVVIPEPPTPRFAWIQELWRDYSRARIDERVKCLTPEECLAFIDEERRTHLELLDADLSHVVIMKQLVILRLGVFQYEPAIPALMRELTNFQANIPDTTGNRDRGPSSPPDPIGFNSPALMALHLIGKPALPAMKARLARETHPAIRAGLEWRIEGIEFRSATMEERQRQTAEFERKRSYFKASQAKIKKSEE